VHELDFLVQSHLFQDQVSALVEGELGIHPRPFRIGCGRGAKCNTEAQKRSERNAAEGSRVGFVQIAAIHFPIIACRRLAI
jgi:hypothetical protein